MSKVVAAIDNSSAARPVLATAAAVARLLSAELEAVHVRVDGARTAQAAAAAAGLPLRVLSGRAVESLLRAGEADGVFALVLGARATRSGRRPAGHVALELALSLGKPLVVVPPHAPAPLAVERILVPLDGTAATAGALANTLRLARNRALEVIVLYVHDEARIPLFGDQPQHELEAWTHEFLARHCPHPEDVRLELRTGVPATHVLKVAEEAKADLIALAWSQTLEPGRAAVVREALERSRVPLLLVPSHG